MPTSKQDLIVSAPGKLMITGEYAVLGGAEAIVAAVNRRAFARFAAEPRLSADGSAAVPVSAPVSAEALAAFEQAQAAVGGTREQITLDTSSMRQGGDKLGLGSSAAAAAAAAGLSFAHAGRDLADPEVRKQVLDLAFRGHRAISPQGSGADVAASVLGGFVRFRKLGDFIEAQPVTWPAGVCVRVVWTGKPARTSDFVAKVAALADRDPVRHRAVLHQLGAEAERFVSAVIDADTPGLLESTAAYGRAMGELGVAAGVEIVTDTLRSLATLAQQSGGAAKPSGAGGGDVALALFPDEARAAHFAQQCAELGLSVLSVELGAPGVRVESPRSEAV